MAQYPAADYYGGLELVPPSDFEVVKFPATTTAPKPLPPTLPPHGLGHNEMHPGLERIPTYGATPAGTALPLPETQTSVRTSKNRINKTCLTLSIIVFLIIVIAALGAGLGVTSKHKHPGTGYPQHHA